MASLQSFQPSADRFCSWLTRVEETAAKLESSGEKLRAQYGDQSIPEEELKPFKVRKPNIKRFVQFGKVHVVLQRILGIFRIRNSLTTKIKTVNGQRRTANSSRRLDVAQLPRME